MTRAERVRALLDEYARQRYQNERDQREREIEAFARDPELENLRARSVALATESLRAAMGEADVEKRRAVAEEMRRRGALLNAETRRRLRALGLPEDYLEERYRCPVCRDTGYVGDAPARFCACFERRLAEGERGSLQGAQTFETFNAALVPEENGQRAQLLEARRLLEEFADRYPQARWRNVVLCGAGGLGKSFLLNCVCERVGSRGYPALRTTAYRMFDAMRKRHLGDGQDTDGFTALLETPFFAGGRSGRRADDAQYHRGIPVPAPQRAHGGRPFDDGDHQPHPGADTAALWRARLFAPVRPRQRADASSWKERT